MAAVIDENTQFTDVAGKPIVNGFIFIGVQNADPQVSPITIFSDRDLSVVLANPQRTDSLGRSVNKIWIPDRYSIEVEDVNNVSSYIELDNGEGAATGITTLDNVLGANTITATASTAITAYVDKEQYVFIAAQINTGAVTLNIDSIGAKSVLKNHTEAIVAGDFEEDQAIIVVFNETDDIFEWTNQNIKNIVNLPFKYIAGLEMTTGADTEHDFSFSVGECRDTANTTDCSLSSALVKQFDANFAEGTLAGGMATGIALPTDGTVHFFIAEKDASPGTFDIIGDTSVTMSQGVAGWTMRRLIGSRTTDGSTPGNFIATIQTGDRVDLSVPAAITAVTNPGTSAILHVLPVPIDINITALPTVVLEDPTPSSATHLLITSPAQADTVPTSLLFDLSIGASIAAFSNIHKPTITDTSARIRTRQQNSAADIVLEIITSGWIDKRGQDD